MRPPRLLARPATRLLAALFAVLAAALPRAADADPEDIAAAARAVVRVVLISSEGGALSLIGHGSGVAVAPNLVLTNAHVIEDAASLSAIRVAVIPPEGSGGSFARIVSLSERNDLALLELPHGTNLPPATLMTGVAPDGADVFAVGYPGNVDMAQGLNIGDIVSPTPPVKTRGSVSSGRPSKQFDTILHTAPIGAGNSGGPLLDACGRVIGANSFGTLSGEADSEFYFAVSMREISRFLLANRIRARTTAAPCQSLDDFARVQADLAAGEVARADLASRQDATRSAARLENAQRLAQMQVFAEREDRMALAGMALLLALATGGLAAWRHTRGQARAARISAGACLVLLGGGALAWFSRPGLAEVDERAREIAQAAQPATPPPPRAADPPEGRLACVLDPARSRVTVSDTADLAFEWNRGCLDGGTAFAPEGQAGPAAAWTRVIVPAAEDEVSALRFEPGDGAYRVERYYPDHADMENVRRQLARAAPPACPASEEALRRLAERDAAIRAALPGRPVETLVYRCDAAGAGAGAQARASNLAGA